MDRLDRRQRPLLGSSRQQELRRARLAEDYLVASQACKHLSRDKRWNYLGLVNEPCFDKPRDRDPERFGLWLDKRSKDCPADPFENEQKYPGVQIGARGKNVPVGSYYGYATGIVGLRLFPNPDFDEAAAKKWDPERYYSDPSYYNDKNLVRPYRVGMSCGFCHVGPSPVKPPADPENPKWENLNSNRGAQYFWVDRIFFWEKDRANFIYQLFHTSRPGTLDTSLVSTDYINNPRTMNAVYSLGRAAGGRRALGQGEARRRRARQQAVQRLLHGPRRWRSSSKRRTPSGRRACSRTAPTRWAPSAR